QRPRSDHQHLLQGRVRLHRPDRPAWTLPLVRSVHPARPGHRRWKDRRPGARGTRRPLLHDASAYRRWPTAGAQAAGDRPCHPRAIADLSRDHGRDTADITNRQNVQYHWIRIEDVPAIWEKLESVGLSTTEACGDTPRVILGCPLAGVADDEIIDATEQIEQI